MKKFYGDIEYKMTKAMADYLLKSRKGDAKKKNNQQYLCDYVNEQCGVKGNCVRVLIDL